MYYVPRTAELWIFEKSPFYFCVFKLFVVVSLALHQLAMGVLFLFFSFPDDITAYFDVLICYSTFCYQIPLQYSQY
jgi:hypothetical protein